LRLTPAGLFGVLVLVLAVPVLVMAWLGAGGTQWPDPRLLSCLATGAIAALLSAWIFALRPRGAAVGLFAVSGFATYGFCLVFPAWTLACWFPPFEPFVEVHRITLAEMVVILLLAPAPDAADRAAISGEGRSLVVPATDGLPAALLHDRDRGRALFTPAASSPISARPAAPMTGASPPSAPASRRTSTTISAPSSSPRSAPPGAIARTR
jgi:hypothetical protein